MGLEVYGLDLHPQCHDVFNYMNHERTKERKVEFVCG